MFLCVDTGQRFYSGLLGLRNFIYNKIFTSLLFLMMLNLIHRINIHAVPCHSAADFF